MASTANDKMLQAYDNALLGILQNEAGLEQFLDVMFGFLGRRTDFYHIMTEPKQRYGFPPGVAEKMVMNYFKKYQKMTEMVRARTEEQVKAKARSKVTEEKKSEAPNQFSTPPQSLENEDTDQTTCTKQSDSEQVSANEGSEVPNKESSHVDFDQSVFQSNPDSYNGAICDRYSWSQNYDDVDVKVPVEKSVVKGAQVKVDIQRKRIKVCVQTTRGGDFAPVIDGSLQHEINREESMWSLESGKNISITLTKDKNIWWTKLLDEDQEIDIQKICPERSMGDMDEEELAVINKLQFDEKQKRLGLPQSHELKVHEMLKKGWDAEGSPFKGQEFDPKMFNISPGAVGE